MPRPALKNVSTASLQAELERRAAKLGKLLKLKEQVDRDIAELQALAGQFGKVVAAEAPAKPVRRRRRRKAKTAKVVAKPVTKMKGKREWHDQTAEQFVLDLLEGKTLTSAELTAAWTKAGRNGKVDNALTRLFKAGTIKRVKIKDGQGSNYRLAGAVAKPVVVKPAAKKPRKRKTYSVTADEFVLGLLKGKTLTTRQLGEAWKAAGRGGPVDAQLSRLVKLGKIKREPRGGKLGSNYNLV